MTATSTPRSSRPAGRAGRLLLLALLGTTLASLPGALGATPARPRTFALLIGVSTYPDLRARVDPAVYERHVRLDAPARDVELLRDALREHLGGRDEDVVVLSDAQDDVTARPTHANILEQMKRLAARPYQSGDRVVVHFSGQGSRARDEESDGPDDVLLPMDADYEPSRGWVRALGDDVVRAHLDAIQQRGAAVWLVLDCGFGGRGLRGLGAASMAVRSLDPQTLGLGPSPEAFRADGGGAVHRGWVTALDGTAVLRAAAAHQEVPEILAPPGTPTSPRYGPLSWALARSLSILGDDATLTDLREQLLTVYEELGRGWLEPQVEGGPTQAVFPRSPTGGDDALHVRVTREGLVLDAGTDRGIEPGTRLTVFTPWRRARARRAVAAVEVVEASLHRALCRRLDEEDVPWDPEVEAWPAVITRTPLDVVLDVAVVTADGRPVPPERWSREVSLAFEQNRAVVEAVADPRDAAWVVVLDDAAAPTWMQPARAGTGTPAFQTKARSLAADLLRVFRAESILRLGRGDVLAPWPRGLTAQVWRASDDGTRAALGGERVSPGPRVALEVRFEAPGDGAVHPMDLHVFWLDAHLGLHAVWPRRGTSPRVAFRDGMVLDLGTATISDDTQGIERLVVCAVEQGEDAPVLDLGFLAQEPLGIRMRTIRPSELAETVSRLFFGTVTRGPVEVESTEGGLALRVQSFTTGWDDVRFPAPSADAAVLRLPEAGDPWPGDDALPDPRRLGGSVWLARAGADAARCLLLARGPGFEQALIDLDGDADAADEEGLASLLADRAATFDAEVAIRRDATAFVAWYDTNDDGIFDLALVDRDKDLRAEERWVLEDGRWSRTSGLDLPWLSTTWLRYLDKTPGKAGARDEALRRIAALAGR